MFLCSCLFYSKWLAGMSAESAWRERGRERVRESDREGEGEGE